MNRSKLKFGLLMLLFVAFGRAYAASSLSIETIYDWSFLNTGLDEEWTYGSAWSVAGLDQPLVGDPTKINGLQSGAITKSYRLSKSYSGIVLTVESPVNLKGEPNFTVTFGDGINTKKCTPRNSDYPNKYKYYIPEHDPTGTFTFTIRINANLAYPIQIKSFKITGYPLYDPTKASTIDYETDNLRQLYDTPKDDVIKFNLKDCEVSLTNHGKAYIQDENSGMAIDIGRSANMTGIELPKKGVFSGTIYGKVKEDNFIKTLYGVTTEIDEVHEDQLLYGLKPIEITEEAYYSGDYIGKYVSFESERSFIVFDPLDYSITNNQALELNLGYASTYTDMKNYKYCGVAYQPYYADEEVCLGYLYTPRHYGYMLFSDKIENNEKLGDAPMPCVVQRNFVANMWHSLVLPFDIDNRWGDLAVLESASDGVLYFQTVNIVRRGHPFLLKPNASYDEIYNIEKPEDILFFDWEDMMNGGLKVMLDSETLYPETCGDYRFVPTFNATQPASGTFYLTAGNTIRPLADGGTIKGLRAYFEPTTPMAAKARAINVDGITTAISEVCIADDLSENTAKVYSVNGMVVGDNLDNLPKGVYVINGKKVIK